jgi:4-amino-4-deoxychorismate lyase
LVESIRIENGKLVNISFHNERITRSLFDLFGRKVNINLANEIIIPDYAMSGLFKCRVEYDNIIRKIEFLLYEIRTIRSLRLVEDNTIEYAYKFTDRKRLDELSSLRGECDEILIVKNGMITDSSYANVIFRDHKDNWVTPSACLLAGTRRSSLLFSGKISETVISYNDIGNYSEVKLINSMLGINDTEGIPTSLIFT